MISHLAHLSPTTSAAQTVQPIVAAAPVVDSPVAPDPSDSPIAPSRSQEKESNTPDAARSRTPIRPRDLLVQCDMFGDATEASEVDHSRTTKPRKPKARKASRAVVVAWTNRRALRR